MSTQLRNISAYRKLKDPEGYKQKLAPSTGVHLQSKTSVDGGAARLKCQFFITVADAVLALIDVFSEL